MLFLCVCVFSKGRSVVVDYFSEGEEAKEEETEAFRFSFVELECLKFKFQ